MENYFQLAEIVLIMFLIPAFMVFFLFAVGRVIFILIGMWGERREKQRKKLKEEKSLEIVDKHWLY